MCVIYVSGACLEIGDWIRSGEVGLIDADDVVQIGNGGWGWLDCVV